MSCTRVLVAHSVTAVGKNITLWDRTRNPSGSTAPAGVSAVGATARKPRAAI
jgi:hypothetical protein